MARHSEESLGTFLSERARRSSDGRLAANAAGGVAAAVAISLWAPFGRAVLLSVAVCFSAYGIWGIADRELSERERHDSPALLLALRAVRTVAVVLGAAAAVNFLYNVLAATLGTWVS